MSIKDELGVTEAQYTELKNGFDKAEESTKPHAVVDANDNIKVVGDPNNTKHNKHDFKAIFNIPVEIAKKEGIEGEEVDGTIKIEKEYKDVIIDAQSTTGIVGAIMTIIPYFYKAKEDGTLGEYNSEEGIVMMKSMRFPEFTDAMYKIAQNALGISDSLIRHLSPMSAFSVLVQVINEYPEVTNTAYDFFQ